MEQPLDVFVCYARKNGNRLQELKVHLALLQSQGIIRLGSDRDIEAGQEWSKEILAKLEAAHIVLLLVSAHFLASPWCDKEMTRALERHRAGTVRVIPIVIASCGWQHTALGDLQALPRGGKPVNTWRILADAWNDVAEGIHQVAQSMSASGETAPAGSPAGTAADAARPARAAGAAAPPQASTAEGARQESKGVPPAALDPEPPRTPNAAIPISRLLQAANTLRDELRDAGLRFGEFLALADLRQGSLRDDEWFDLVKQVHAGRYAAFGDRRDAVSALVAVAVEAVPKNTALDKLLADLG